MAGPLRDGVGVFRFSFEACDLFNILFNSILIHVCTPQPCCLEFAAVSIDSNVEIFILSSTDVYITNNLAALLRACLKKDLSSELTVHPRQCLIFLVLVTMKKK